MLIGANCVVEDVELGQRRAIGSRTAEHDQDQRHAPRYPKIAGDGSRPTLEREATMRKFKVRHGQSVSGKSSGQRISQSLTVPNAICVTTPVESVGSAFVSDSSILFVLP